MSSPLDVETVKFLTFLKAKLEILEKEFNFNYEDFIRVNLEDPAALYNTEDVKNSWFSLELLLIDSGFPGFLVIGFLVSLWVWNGIEQVIELFSKFMKNVKAFNEKENRKIVHLSSVYVRKVLEEGINGGVSIEINKEDVENR